MKTTITRILLPLAALTLASSACDPFPAKPGGAPSVVRVTTHGPDASNTVENTDGDGTVVTDFAWVNDTIHVQFSKPMDGTSIQGNSQYNPDGTIKTDAANNPVKCEAAAGLTLSLNFPPGTEVCYEPNSPTDGGNMVIRNTDVLMMRYGEVYTVTGSVKDYEGKSLAINVTVTVDQRPLPFNVDGYTQGVDWFYSGADSYEVLQSTDGTAYTSLGSGLAADLCNTVICEVPIPELVPHTEYWYQVKETRGATTTTRQAVLGPLSTGSPLTPTFGVATTVTPPITVLKGIIRVAWGGVFGANGYDLETSPNGTDWTLAAHQTGRTYYAGTPAPSTAVPTSGSGSLVSGTTYWFRVTPTFANTAFVPVKGNAAKKAAP